MEALFTIIGILVVGIIVFALAKGGVFHRPTIEEIGEHGENTVSQFLSCDPNSIVFNDIILVDNKRKVRAK